MNEQTIGLREHTMHLLRTLCAVEGITIEDYLELLIRQRADLVLVNEGHRQT